jgi:hypothetical protein
MSRSNGNGSTWPPKKGFITVAVPAGKFSPKCPLEYNASDRFAFYTRTWQKTHSISCTPQGVKLTGAAVPTAQVTTPPETLPTSLLEALEAEAKADQWDVNSLHVIDNGRALAAAILRGDAKAVSNGSFKNTKGSFLLQSKGS